MRTSARSVSSPVLNNRQQKEYIAPWGTLSRPCAASPAPPPGLSRPPPVRRTQRGLARRPPPTSAGRHAGPGPPGPARPCRADRPACELAAEVSLNRGFVHSIPVDTSDAMLSSRSSQVTLSAISDSAHGFTEAEATSLGTFVRYFALTQTRVVELLQK